MRNCESEQWQKVSPLLYSFLANLPAPRYSSITTTSHTRNPGTSFFNFDEYRTILAGQSQANNGLLSINNLLIPQGGQIDDVRFKPTLKAVCQLNFESQVTHFGECMRNESDNNSSGFLVISERRNPQIYIYESIALEKCRDKASINPRMMLKGHETEITSIRSRRNDILNCSKNGDIRLHTLPHGDPSVTYKYHRDPVNDCCWLTSQDDSQFLTASSDGIIYIWDKRSSLPVSKIEPKQGELYCLQPLKDRCFLSGGKDGTIKLYDVRSGVNKFYIFKDHTAPITFIKKLQAKDSENDHPHQTIFVSGAANGEVFIWGEQLEFTHLSHSSEIKSISYERNMELFMTVQKRSPSLCLWRPAIYDFQ